MEDGPIGVSGQSAEVDVDRVNKREGGLVPTPGRWTEGEVAKDMLRRGENATLGDLARNPLVSIIYKNVNLYSNPWVFSFTKGES